MDNICNVLNEICGFLFGGCFSSYLIAKFVINRKVDKEINNLKKHNGSLQKQKENLIKNTRFLIDDFAQFLPTNKSNEYIEGWKHGVEQTREMLKTQLEYGLDSHDILESDWEMELYNEQ